MVEVFEHASFTDDVPHALRAYDCDTASALSFHRWVVGRTFIFPDVFESECEAGVFSLDDAHLSKGTFSNDSQQSEVVEVD